MPTYITRIMKIYCNNLPIEIIYEGGIKLCNYYNNGLPYFYRKTMFNNGHGICPNIKKKSGKYDRQYQILRINIYIYKGISSSTLI